jgi:hypothetical protein
MLALALPATGADKFPLTMNAVFTKGHTGDASKDATYSSDDYRCTKGDENHAPECQTVTEWAMLDSVAGTPDTVVFTMADGTVVKVQPRTVKKLPGYIVCDPGTGLNLPGYQVGVYYCDVYFALLEKVNATSPVSRTEIVSGSKQEVQMSPAEMMAATEANTKKLFGNGNSFTVAIPYRLKGKPDKHTGMQAVEVDAAVGSGLPNITGTYLPSPTSPVTQP